MTSEKQIDANRRNALNGEPVRPYPRNAEAQPSTSGQGAKTEAGHNRSRMNALRHGLTGQIEVTTPEEKEAKDKFFGEIISSLAPESAIENQFAHSVADGHWRLNRASSIENNIFTLACSFQAAQAQSVRCAADPSEAASDETENPEVDKALGAARVFIADPRRFQLLTVYEQRIHRNMSKNLKPLTELQATRRALEAERNAKREQALEEARLHSQLAEMEGVPCDIATDFPDPNGFVFSSAEIAQSIRRISHLKAAKRAESSNWNLPARRAA